MKIWNSVSKALVATVDSSSPWWTFSKENRVPRSSVALKMSAREKSNFQLTFSISSQSESQAAVFLLAGVLLFSLPLYFYLVTSFPPRTRGCIPEHLVCRILSHFFCDADGISFAEISEMWKLTPTMQSVGRKYGLDESSNKQHRGARLSLIISLARERATRRCCQADQDTFAVSAHVEIHSQQHTYGRKKLPSTVQLRCKLCSTHSRVQKTNRMTNDTIWFVILAYKI